VSQLKHVPTSYLPSHRATAPVRACGGVHIHDHDSFWGSTTICSPLQMRPMWQAAPSTTTKMGSDCHPRPEKKLLAPGFPYPYPIAFATQRKRMLNAPPMLYTVVRRLELRLRMASTASEGNRARGQGTSAARLSGDDPRLHQPQSQYVYINRDRPLPALYLPTHLELHQLLAPHLHGNEED
jgi:hypothetical protein